MLQNAADCRVIPSSSFIHLSMQNCSVAVICFTAIVSIARDGLSSSHMHTLILLNVEQDSRERDFVVEMQRSQDNAHSRDTNSKEAKVSI